MNALLSKLTLREQVIAGGIAILIVGVLLSKLLWPLMKEYQALQHEHQSLLKALSDLKSQPQALAPQSPFSAEDFLRGGALTRTYVGLTRLAKSHQLELTAVKPGTAEDKNLFMSYPVELDLQGRYRDLVDFLDILDQAPLWLLVEEVRIEVIGDRAPQVMAHMRTVILGEKKTP